jgi:polar amino acid transport system substrate-binding protein
MLRSVSRLSHARSAVASAWRAAAPALATAVLAGGLLAACGADTSSPAAGTFTPHTPGVLTVATSSVPSAGFWEGTPSHPTGGLEYELARDLADRFGLGSVRVKLVHFHQIVSGRLDGADLALALITPTAERGQFLDFSAPYLDAAPTVIVRRGTAVPDLSTAQDLRWGAVRATTFVSTIQTAIAPALSLRTYDSSAEMLAALKNHEIDAALLDMPQAVVTAQRSRGTLAAVAQLPDSESIAAALPKGSSNGEAIDSAMRAFTADGTLTSLLRRWVGPAAADAQSSIPLLHSTR